MEKIYMAAYKDYADYDNLKIICDKITSNMDKNDVTFFVTTGESGDNTCTKYAVDNGFKIEDWFPDDLCNQLKQEIKDTGHWHKFYNVLKNKKSEYISKANHVILVSDYDLKNNGIGYAMRLAAKNGKTLSVYYPDINEIHVHKLSNVNIRYVYKIDNGMMVHSRNENVR